MGLKHGVTQAPHSPEASVAKRETADRRVGRRKSRHPRLPFHYAIILPALLLTIAIILLPLIYSIGISLWHYRLNDPNNTHFVGLDNYQSVFRQTSFGSSLKVTVIYAGSSVLLEFALGFGIAFLVNHLVRLKGIVRTAIMLPFFITPVVAALMWRFMLNPSLGVINYYLQKIGILGNNVAWLGNQHTALGAVILVGVWRNTPFLFLVFLAGLQSIPQELYEAATIDGANAFQVLRRVTLPLLKPLILVGLVIRVMDALREFDTIFVLTGGGPGRLTEVVSLTAYRLGFKNFDLGLGSAMSFIVFALVLILSIAFVFQVQRSRVD